MSVSKALGHDVKLNHYLFSFETVERDPPRWEIEERLVEMATDDKMEQSDDQYADDKIDVLIESEFAEAIFEAENT